jgi:predicted nuclease of predicted toxin-antitoxin system
VSPLLILLMDNNVPDRVSDFLRERGHDVRLVRDLFPSGTADIVILAWANEQSAIVVTHDRDFHRLIQRAQTHYRDRAHKAGRISLLGLEMNARKRVEDFIESIEFEHLQVQQILDKRLIVEITDSAFRIVR